MPTVDLLSTGKFFHCSGGHQEKEKGTKEMVGGRNAFEQPAKVEVTLSYTIQESRMILSNTRILLILLE